ncbi:hypothetical protein CPC16_006079, partial [Podila verticillata]
EPHARPTTMSCTTKTASRPMPCKSSPTSCATCMRVAPERCRWYPPRTMPTWWRPEPDSTLAASAGRTPSRARLAETRALTWLSSLICSRSCTLC